MSAWLVSKGHIDVLVQAALVEGLLPNYAQTPDDLGKLLWLENHLSLEARYGDDVPDDIEYTFRGVEAPLGDAHLSAAIHCYNYQSCEHDAWWEDACAAHKLTNELLERVLNRNSGKDPWSSHEMMSGTKWGYDSIEEAIA